MEGIRTAGLMICILMVLMAYLKQAIPKGKSTYLMKAIISIFILLSIVNGIRSVNWKSLESLLDRSYSHHEEIWENTANLMEKGLIEEFQRFLEQEEIQATILDVEVTGEVEDFSVSKVLLYGTDATMAAKLLAGRYQIGMEMIEVVNG